MKHKKPKGFNILSPDFLALAVPFTVGAVGVASFVIAEKTFKKTLDLFKKRWYN